MTGSEDHSKGLTHRNEHGQFLPGHGRPGPGRPKGVGNIRTIAAEKAEAEGVDLQQAIWEVVKSLFKSASAGDVAAARLLLDRLTDTREIGGDTIVQVVTGVPRSDEDELKDLL